MKKFKFVIHTLLFEFEHEIEKEAEDDVTEKELEDYLRQFILDNIEGYWEEIESEDE